MSQNSVSEATFKLRLGVSGCLLGEEDYADRPPKESSARYDAKQRRKLYRLFEKYEVMRRKNCDWDVSDAVNHVYAR